MSAWSRSLLAAACAVALYLPWLSIQLDPNGITEATAIETGGVRLVDHNHLLNRPIGALLVATMPAADHERVLGRLQVLTAVCAALAVGLALRAYAALTPYAWAALLASAAFATSWAQWRYSTDAHYIALSTAALLAAIAAAALARSAFVAALAGIACAVGVLAWQANICAVSALALMVWLAARRSVRPVAAFLIAVAVPLALGYAIVYAAAADGRGPIAWLTSYGGGALPIWGRWELARVVPAAVTWIKSIVPLSEGVGLRALLHGETNRDKLLGQLAVAALAVLSAITAVRGVAALRRDPARLGVLLLGFVLYLPFIVWWDPFEPQWFIAPNAFAFAAAAIVWGGGGPAVRRTLYLCVAVIAAANFRYTILPHHTLPNVWIARARCVTERVHAHDAVIVTDWDWFAYAQYLFGYDGGRVHTVDTRPREEKLAEIAAAIDAAHRRGGRVYAVDVRTYDAERAQWLTVQTGLSPLDLDRFGPAPAFACDGLPFVELSAPPPGTT